MLTIEGVYKDGKIELPSDVPTPRQAKVLVTFLESGTTDLRAAGISEKEAAELRDKLATFEDWNDAALDVYNDYDSAKSALEERP